MGELISSQHTAIPLTLSDFFLLRSLLSGETPHWTQDALFRCHKRGLITQDGTRLTPDGHERASLFDKYVNALWQGVPLSDITWDNLSDYAEMHEDWHRKRYRNDEQYQCSPHVLIFSGGPVPLRYKRIYGKPLNPLLSEWIRKLNAKSWERAIPFAYQAEPRLDGLRTICFQSKFHAEHYKRTGEPWNYRNLCLSNAPAVDRIQAQYYDYILNRYPDATWWRQCHGNINRDYMGARVKDGKRYLGNGFVALIKVVKTINWPSPMVDFDKLDKKKTTAKGGEK